MLLATLSPASNRATLTIAVEVRDADTNDLVDLTDHRIDVEIRRQDDAYPYSASGDCGAILTASTEDGSIAIVGPGTFQAQWAKTKMGGLYRGTYDIGAIVTYQDETAQLIIGTLPVLEGVVKANVS